MNGLGCAGLILAAAAFVLAVLLGSPRSDND